MKRLVSFLALALFLALAHAATAQDGLQPVTPWSDPAVRTRLEPALLKQIVEAQPGQRVPMIVVMNEQADLAAAGVSRADQVTRLQQTAERNQRSVRLFLQGEAATGRVDAVRSFWIFNGLALRGTPDTALALAQRDDVAFIRLDHYELRLAPETITETSASDPAWGVARVGADRVWSALGFTGQGVIVANMDTGVDYQHPALKTSYRGYGGKEIYQHLGNWFDATDGGAAYPYDGNGHGTHTMGTIAGADGIGVAPGARWIAVRVLNNSGYAYDSWIHSGFQWLLAPDGNASLAPNIVNNSWGSSIGSSIEFQADLARLRAGGILAVFSAGNAGPEPGSLDSPASLPGVLAVGAVDSDDEVASFSGRGPSPWNEIKPQVAAPGVNVRSAIPGGAYGVMSGTSMAAPHVAGVAALMLSAQPHLSIDATVYALTSTAVARGIPIPNTNTGWGRIDAYAAVQAVSGAGILSGQVIDHMSLLPVADAQVTARRDSTGTVVAATTDADGRFAVGLAAGPYHVAAGRFDYIPFGPAPTVIVTGTTTTLGSLELVPLARGSLSVYAVETLGHRPATVTVTALGTPISKQVVGHDQLEMPVGNYTIQARGVGYRVMTATVTIRANEVTQQTFDLTPTDRILLVNSGAWYYGEYPSYFRQALDELGYSYNEWRVKHPPADSPALADLTKYDLVIWSAPEDSPGLIGSSGVITAYLSQGGKLLLTGQDVAYWDGGGSGLYWAPYLRNYLMTNYVRDDAGSRSVSGLAGDFLAPLAFGISGGDGANNQYAPDEIAIANGDHAQGVLAYVGNGLAATKVGLCLKYRALVLGFGFESVNSSAARRDLLGRSLDYLTEPRASSGLSVSPVSPTVEIGPAGSVVTFTVRARNIAETGSAVTYAARVQSADWKATVAPEQVELGPCTAKTLTVTVQIPAGLAIDSRNPLTLTVQGVDRPDLMSAVTLTAKTPAPVLLIDHRHWYDDQALYSRVLDKAGIAYDMWTLPQAGPPSAFNGPAASWLKNYPIVFWFTGYDWYKPLAPYDEEQLGDYLDGGGRLLLSSPFYLDLRAGSPFAHDRLGVITYTWGMTATATYPSPAASLSAGFGRMALNNPYPRSGFFTLDRAIVPGPAADVAWRGDHNRPQALALQRSGNRLVFWDLPIEALPAQDQADVLRRIAGWLGPLGDSTAGVIPSVVPNGGGVTINVVVRNNFAPTTAWLTVTLPSGLDLVAEDLPTGFDIDAGRHTITWHGPLGAGQSQALALRAQVNLALPGWLSGQVQFGDTSTGLVYDQPLRLGVDTPVLVTTLAPTAAPRAGQPVTLQMTVRNEGHGVASDARAVGLPPIGTHVITGTARLDGPGKMIEAFDDVTWQGSLAPGQAVTLTYQVGLPQRVAPEGLAAELLTWDGQGGAWERRTWLVAELTRWWFPWATHG